MVSGNSFYVRRRCSAARGERAASCRGIPCMAIRLALCFSRLDAEPAGHLVFAERWLVSATPGHIRSEADRMVPCILLERTFE